ncbi:hypothetical protein L7F22_064258 [Adiantum nelumboides]|nr:hypothetical protein [Adiantum nelumboides]
MRVVLRHSLAPSLLRTSIIHRQIFHIGFFCQGKSCIYHVILSCQCYNFVQMDTCIRNLSFAHHIAALSPLENRGDMNEKARYRAGGFQLDSCEEEVLCPKPRRMALSCCAPEFIKPLYQWQNTLRLAECDAGYEILEIFMNKGGCTEGEYLSLGCSPPFCSPPTRATNPIVHDRQFRNGHGPCSPVPYVNSKAVAVPSFSASPSMRIEGFDCPRAEV